MRSIFWPIALFIILEIVMQAVLAVWLPVQFVPNLLTAGVLILALAHVPAQSWFWIAVCAGALIDMQSSLLFGSYMLGFGMVYLGVQSIFPRFVPAERVYVALPAAYVVSSIFLLAWVLLIGRFASLLGWPIVPTFSLAAGGPWVFSVIAGAVSTLVVYILWLEILHQFDRPLRLKA